jgi:hypothetical protein
MSEGPNVGQVLVGIFVILCGLCMTLVGGGCTYFILASMGPSGSGLGGFLLISLVVLGLGGLLLWVGVKVVRGGYRN